MLGGGETPQAALANLGAGVRPNLLDNAIFIGGGSQQGGGQLPINQRGQTSYGNNVPAIDRWITTTDCSSLTISQDGVTCNAIIAGQYPFQSYFDADYSDFAGKTVTISALVDDSLLCATGVVPAQKPSGSNIQMIMSESGGSYDIGFGYNAYKDLFSLGFFARVASASAKFKAAKIEEGTAQTLAYQDEDGAWQLLPQPESDYATQLLRCQRYLLRLGLSSAAVCVRVSRIISGNHLFCIPTPIKMRTVPVISGEPKVITMTNGSQSGFTFSTGVFENCVMLYAYKQDSGLTDCHLSLTDVFLSAEL